MNRKTPLHIYTWAAQGMAPRHLRHLLPQYIQVFYEPEFHRTWARLIHSRATPERDRYIQEALDPARRSPAGACYDPVLYNDSDSEEDSLPATGLFERVDLEAQQLICDIMEEHRDEVRSAPTRLEGRIAAELRMVYEEVFGIPAPPQAPATPDR